MTDLSSLVPGWSEIQQAIRKQGIALLRRYVQQESVSCGTPCPIPKGIREMVGLVHGYLCGDVDCEELYTHHTATYDVVTATVRASHDPDNAPWLLLYNMGDTRPLGDEKEWLVPSLSCETVEVKGERRIIGRGVFNSKSGLAGMIDVIQLLKEQGRLPVNLEILVDFEEEVRVDSVREVLTKNKERYAKCQAALMPLCAEKFKAIWLGFKGVAVARVTFKQDRSQVHSGMESVLKIPPLRWALNQFLNHIERGNCGQLEIEALRGGVTSKDQELAEKLAESMDLQTVADGKGVKVSELRSQDVAQAILDESRSHVNVLSWGSEHCEGTVPNVAFAELEFRISPSVMLSVAEIEKQIEGYLRYEASFLPDEITLESVEFVAGTGEGFRAADPDDPVVKTLQESYGAFGVEMSLVPSLFGSCPEGAVIRRALGVPFLVGGLGVGDRAHVPNEYILEGAYQRLKEWLVVFLHQFAQQQ